MYSPFQTLLIFFIIVLIVYLVFRPTNGWFWIVKKNRNTNEKTITEDVLKQIYHSENSLKDIDINSLTSALDFDDDLIIKTINRMTANELIFVEKDLLKLSDAGREYALRIVRVHRLWEKYLAEKTGFDKKEWHDRAEEMEHRLNHEETDLLATQLGNPMYDPHGDPIPTKKGKVAKLDGVTLSSLAKKSIGKISHIEDEPEVIYKQILAANIHIGSQIRVVENNTKRVVFYSEGEEFILAPIVAANITVSLLEKEAMMEDNLIRLSNLQKEETALIIGISKECRGENRRRLLDLGFVRNAEISIDLMSPLKNPIAYLIKGSSIALRNDQASKILIKKV